MIKKLLIILSFLFIASTSFAATPVILYTDIIAGPDSGGEGDDGCYLSIFGFNFGTPSEGLPPATTTVEINGEEIETAGGHYKYMGTCRGRSDIQQISVQVGDVEKGAITVITADGTSNSNITFTVSAGDIYYIDDTGDDTTGDGSYANPYLTPGKVYNLEAFGAGDFLIVRGGTYDIASTWMTLTKDGASATSCINVMGYPGETPLLDKGASVTQTAGFMSTGGTYFNNISNFRINLQGSNAWAFYFGSNVALSNWFNDGRIVNCYIEEGMLGSGANETSYVNSHQMMWARVDRLKVYGCNFGNSSALAGCRSHVIYLADAYDRLDYGWNVMQNVAHGRAALQIAGDSGGDGMRSDRVDAGENGVNFYGYNADAYFHDSLFYNLPEAAILCNLGSFGPLYFYNNIVDSPCQSTSSGFSAIALRGAIYETGAGIYHFYNNTVYADAAGTPGGILQMGYDPGNTAPISVTLYNNIFNAITNTTDYYQAYQNYGFDVDDDITSDYNLWYGSTDSAPSWTGEGTNDQGGDPVFTNAAGHDFTIGALSDAIDHGSGALVNSYVLADYAGASYGATTYEIGAYLYGAGGETYVSTDQHSPAKDAITVAKDSNIVVHVKQGTYTVDSATIAMTVEGGDVTGSLAITGTAADYTVTYDPASDFTSGQVVNVTVDASDTDTPANAMPQDVYSFTVEYFGTANTSSVSAMTDKAGVGTGTDKGMVLK